MPQIICDCLWNLDVYFPMSTSEKKENPVSISWAVMEFYATELFFSPRVPISLT